MADLPGFESPIKATSTGASALTLSDESSLTKTIVRAERDTAAVTQLGVAFGSSRSSNGLLVCGQRPTEWVLIGDDQAVTDWLGALDTTGHVSVIDITHARALIRLTGDRAPSLLEKVCNLDWSDAMTPNGATTSGSVAKVTCDLIRNDKDGSRSYLISCDRSFGQYLFDALFDAGAEFEVGVD